MPRFWAGASAIGAAELALTLGSKLADVTNGSIDCQRRRRLSRRRECRVALVTQHRSFSSSSSASTQVKVRLELSTTIVDETVVAANCRQPRYSRLYYWAHQASTAGLSADLPVVSTMSLGSFLSE